MHSDGVVRPGLGAGSLLQHFVLQAAGQGRHAGIVLVRGEKPLSFDLVRGGRPAGHAGLPGLKLPGELLEAGLNLRVFQCRGAAPEGVGQSLHHELRIDLRGLHFKLRPRL